MASMTPGPWMPYGGGRRVRCKEPVDRKRSLAGSVVSICGKVVLAIGRRKMALVRIVGKGETPAEVEGSTFRCDCGTIYEVEWWDRRHRDRTKEFAERREA